MKRRRILLIFTILWVAFIFLQSIQTGEVSGNTSGRITLFLVNTLEKIGVQLDFQIVSILLRKLAHFTEFFILGVLLHYLYESYNFIIKHTIILSIISGVMIAITDEFIQTFVEGRAGTIVDVGIDTLGILAAFVFYFIIYVYKKKSH